MLSNRWNVLSRVEVHGLAEFLEIAPIPVNKSVSHEGVLLNSVFLGEVNYLNSREIGAILGVNLLLDELLESIRPREEAIVLDNL